MSRVKGKYSLEYIRSIAGLRALPGADEDDWKVYGPDFRAFADLNEIQAAKIERINADYIDHLF